MYINLSYNEVRKILQEHFDNLGVGISVEHVGCKSDRTTGLLDEITLMVSSKPKAFKEAKRL